MDFFKISYCSKRQIKDSQVTLIDTIPTLFDAVCPDIWNDNK